MDILNYVDLFSTVAKVKKVTADEYEIITEAKINSKTPIKIYLCKENENIVLKDNKNTLKYMNKIYELNSVDVRDCIASVIKIYKFTIQSGSLVASLNSLNNSLEVFYNFIICCAQLANMYAFFDKPE